MNLWSFETIHCLNFNTQRQKRHGVTNDVKVNFLICRFVWCMENTICLDNILFFLIKCVIEFTEKLTLIHVFLKFAYLMYLLLYCFFASHGLIFMSPDANICLCTVSLKWKLTLFRYICYRAYSMAGITPR